MGESKGEGKEEMMNIGGQRKNKKMRWENVCVCGGGELHKEREKMREEEERMREIGY